MSDEGIDLAALFPTDPDREARIEMLEKILFEDGAQPYLLIDAAASPEISTYLEGFSEPARCLFDGVIYDDLSEVSPWLAELKRHGDVFDWFVEEGFGQNWGVFIQSELPLARLKIRLKAHLYVHDENDERLFFKFYRPRALHDFVPVMSDAQRKGFFRGIDAYLAESANGLTRMQVDEEGRLSAETMPLSAAQKEALTRN